MKKEDKPTRRVYAAELRVRLGCGETWLRELEKRGQIPQGRKDPGAKRKWWPDDEADAIISGSAAARRTQAAA